MSANEAALAALILLLFPMLYFLIASLTFFLAKLQDPVVTRLLRGLFHTYFTAVGVLGAIGTLAFLLAGRPMVATALAAIAALAVAARGWFLHHVDAWIRARDAGNAEAVRRLRRLHLGGIAYNAVQLAVLVLSIPRIFPTA